MWFEYYLKFATVLLIMNNKNLINFIIFTFIVYPFLVKGKFLVDEEYLIFNTYQHCKENAIHFTNRWIVKLTDGNSSSITEIATNNGYRHNGMIHDFRKYHIFEQPDHPEKQNMESLHHTFSLMKHKNIEWAEQLYNRKLYKRDEYINEPVEGQKRSRYEREFNDELWPLQWYEQDYRLNTTNPILDMNLVPVYKEFNITGNGIIISIIDDGIEYTHEDLKEKFIHEISYNLNRGIRDILPRYEDPRNRHGTRCAGVAAMKANNKKCGVGVAYNAKVGGITLLDGVTDDLMESKAIKYGIEKVDIYSGSWGPQDNGQQLDGPGTLASKALHYGSTFGRNGLGALYVFAAGNGGSFGDHCGADGYVNNLYSIVVASATQEGNVPYYAEKCPAIIATTYSGSSMDKIKIVTTDLHNSCTLEHSGTSASAPFVAGILALVLEARKDLTWRDVHHLMILTSEMKSLNQEADWQQNGFGLWYSPQFGFGLINAYEMVSLAKIWEIVPEKYVCSVPFDIDDDQKNISTHIDFVSAMFTNACDSIEYLEHVQLIATLTYPVRGHIEVILISPSGTTSKLLEVRKYDRSSNGFKQWTFLSVQFWGEQPTGIWSVIISDKMKKGKHTGFIDHLELVLHGTKIPPKYYAEMNNQTIMDEEDLVMDQLNYDMFNTKMDEQIADEENHKSNEEDIF